MSDIKKNVAGRKAYFNRMKHIFSNTSTFAAGTNAILMRFDLS